MISSEQVAAWRDSADVTERLAAVIVRWGGDKEPWTMVPYGNGLTSIPFEAGEWDAALRLLAGLGFLKQVNREYFIAPA